MIRLALTLWVVAAEPATDPDAEAGVRAFAQGRYDDAATILARAYAEDPRPELLFAWAQAERYAERCDDAVPLFREYLTLDPPPEVGDKAREAIEACGEDPDVAVPVPVEPPTPEDRTVEPVGPVEAGEPAVEPSPAVPRSWEPSRRPVALDPWGHALLWSGVAICGVGGGLLGEAHLRRRAGSRVADEQSYRDALQGAPQLSGAGIGVLVVGGALVVAGAVRFVVLAARHRRAGNTATLRRGPGQFSLAPRRFGALR